MRDHIIDLDDKNYLSPSSDFKRDRSKNRNIISFQEDLEHFKRNENIILKISKIPDVNSI